MKLSPDSVFYTASALVGVGGKNRYGNPRQTPCQLVVIANGDDHLLFSFCLQLGGVYGWQVRCRRHTGRQQQEPD